MPFFFDLQGEGQSPPESLRECSHFPFFCIFGHVAVFLLFLSVFLFLTTIYKSTNIVCIVVGLIFFVDAFIDMGCTELKPWMDIITDLLFTWKGHGRMSVFSLSWRVARILEEVLDL